MKELPNIDGIPYVCYRTIRYVLNPWECVPGLALVGLQRGNFSVKSDGYSNASCVIGG